MKLAIMQPYLFPYIGYFQLINLADKFILYDDVNYINRGWINRNRILVNGQPSYFTVPLKKASQNKLIKDIELSGEHKWRSKLLKTIQLSYKKAPLFPEVFPALENLFSGKYDSIAEFNYRSLQYVCDYLGVQTELLPTSTIYNNDHLKGQERILDICLQEGADTYINPIGGKTLYQQSLFSSNGVELLFHQSRGHSYEQFGDAFVPNLSIIDYLMFLDKAAICQTLTAYQLVVPEHANH